MSKFTRDGVDGFRAEKASNGGWTVLTVSRQGMMSDLLGAFTTPADMIAFLAKELGVPVAIGVKDETLAADPYQTDGEEFMLRWLTTYIGDGPYCEADILDFRDRSEDSVRSLVDGNEPGMIEAKIRLVEKRAEESGAPKW